jgi:hypothetical protein
LRPLPIPQGVWESVGVDFIGPLPAAEGAHNCIMVVVDRFSKMVMVRACHLTIKAHEAGALLLEMMLTLGKLPVSIVSDRDVRFTSGAWGQLWRGLKTELKMSTAYHPQTDGQTERMNRTIETILRAYAESREDWERWLQFAAAAYNSARQETTQRTPFELNFPDARAIDPLQWALGETRKTGVRGKNGKVKHEGVSVEAERTITEMKVIWDEVTVRMATEQARQKKYADRKRVDVRYEAGDSVWLSTENIGLFGGKMVDKWIGPYVVTEVLPSGVSVRLDLRGELGKTHPVFHVSRVKAYNASEFEWPGRVQPNRPAPVLVDGETEWDVESIEDKKVEMVRKRVTKVVEARKGQRGGTRDQQVPPRAVTTYERVPVVWYRVRWLGWDESYDTWQKESDLENSRQLIEEYELRKSRVEAKAGTAVVELGVATDMLWRLTDKTHTQRRGQPTVRCSFARVDGCGTAASMA